MVKRAPPLFSVLVCAGCALALTLWPASGSADYPRTAAAVSVSTPTPPPPTGGPDRFGYTYDATVPFEWKDTLWGAEIPQTWTYACRGPYDIGFSFTFYGAAYTRFWVSTAGYVAFGGLTKPPNCDDSVNRYIPYPSVPNAIACALWDQLDMYVKSVICYKLLGAAPQRWLVVEWNKIGQRGDGSPMTFQAVFYEGSNEIRFQYQSVSGNNYGDGKSATIGIENGDGTMGLQYSYNRANALRDGLVIAFRPPATAPTPGLLSRRLYLPVILRQRG